MAGATREAVDPVEIAKHDIGSSRRLIAASLDDLSAHHSWLETYHRDERLRAERLRRRQIVDRLKLIYRRIQAQTKLAARTSYVGSRLALRSAKRHSLAIVAWATPRLATYSQSVAASAVDAWRWSRHRIPNFAHRAARAAGHHFCWSVQASEQAGYVFRRHASATAATVTAALRRRTAPIRMRGASEWSSIRRQTQSARASIEQRLAESILDPRELARIRRSLHREYVRGLKRVAPLMGQMYATAVRFEDRLTTLIIRTAPAFRQLLATHMPRDRTPASSTSGSKGYALIRRPTTALTCVVPSRNRLPVPYQA